MNHSELGARFAAAARSPMNSLFLTRRDFLARAALIVGGVRSGSRVAGSETLRVAVVGLESTADTPRGLGATLGVEEVRHAASLFGRVATLQLEPFDGVARGLTAILGDGDLARCQAIAKESDEAGVLFLNVACNADALRAECRPNVFHVAPSEAMLRDAIDGQATGDASVTAWHPSLSRFGADTLNLRFSNRFRTAMTDEAWCAWFAAKMLWESLLGARSPSPAAIGAFAVRRTTKYDGHKGRPLSFRSWDHQLRQPLYVQRGADVVEVPVADASTDARTALDRLGRPAGTGACRE